MTRQPTHPLRIVRYLPLLSGLLLAIAALPGCSLVRPEPPEVSLVDLKVGEMRVFETDLIVTVRYDNPTESPFQVAGASHRVIINDIKIGQGSSDRSFTVPPFGSTTDTFTVHLSNFSILRQVQALLDSQRVNYLVKSRLSLGGSSWPSSAEATNEGVLDFTAAKWERESHESSMRKLTETTDSPMPDATPELNTLPPADDLVQDQAY